MSRKKNFTAKLTADSPPREKLQAAIYGDRRDPQAIELLNLWRKSSSYIASSYELQRLGADWDEYEKHIAAELSQQRVDCLEQFAARVDDAIRDGDGSFFRAFADTIEKQYEPADDLIDIMRLAEDVDAIREKFNPIEKLRAAVGIVREITARFHAPPVTLNKIHKGIQELLRAPVDKDYLRRICKEMGLPLVKGKDGRPKGKKGRQKKSGNSRRRKS